MGMSLHPLRPHCPRRRARLRLLRRLWYAAFTIGPRRALSSLIARCCVLVRAVELQVGSVASCKNGVALLKRQIVAAERSCARKVRKHDSAILKLTLERDAEIGALQARVRVLEGDVSLDKVTTDHDQAAAGFAELEAKFGDVMLRQFVCDIEKAGVL